MAQIQKGTTYSTGDQVTATNLNALADAAILLPGAITDQTAKTVPLAADTVLIHSAADTALRKSTLTQLFSNATGIPISTAISGLGTGVATALAVNVGSAGAPVVNGGALGTPASGTVTNLTGTASININGTVGATTANTGAFTTGTFSGGVTLNNSDPTITLNRATSTGFSTIANLRTAGATTGGWDIYGSGAANQTINFYSHQAAAVVGSFTSTGLNSTAIGATTASTGAFTTLSASGVFSFNANGTSTVGPTTGNTILRVRGGNTASADGSAFYLDNGGTVVGALGNKSNVLGGAYNANTLLYNLNNLEITAGGTSTVGTFSSTGLAVTGALSGTTLYQGASGAQGLNVGFSGAAGQGFSLRDTTNSRTYFFTTETSTGLQINAGANPISLIGSSVAVTGALSSTTGATFATSSGSVGIGDTSPSSNGKLSIIVPSAGYTASAAAWVGSNGTGTMRLWIGNLAYAGVGANEPWLHSYQNINIGSDANIAIKFISGGEKARIDSSGNFCVGKTGDVLANTGCFLDNRGSSTFTRDAAPATYINRLTSDGDALVFLRSTTQVGAVNVSTTATAYNTSSDYRLKDISGPLINSGTFIDALKPKVGTWKVDGSKFVGFLAHEFAEVSPSSVTGEKDAVDADGKPVYQAMQASSAEVIANLVAELQSLRQRVAALESN